MSGHSKWSQIKHRKGVTDQKRGQLFSKLLSAVAVAARANPNPQFNPRLRAAIDKAREHNVPNDNIERAVRRASEAGEGLEEIILEAYGPGGAALLIEAVTDNRNRTIAEVKKILSAGGGKWAEQGSVRWAFEQTSDGASGGRIWRVKFTQAIPDDARKKLDDLIQILEGLDGIERVYSNLP